MFERGFKLVLAIILFILTFIVSIIVALLVDLIVSALLALPYAVYQSFRGYSLGFWDEWADATASVFRVVFIINGVLGGIVILSYVLGGITLITMDTLKNVGVVVGIIGGVLGVIAAITKLGFNIEVQQVIVCRIPDAEFCNPVFYVGACSTFVEFA